MKKVAVVLFVAGCFMSIYATDARIIGMGKHDAFFMDETSVFRNPANLNYFPNMILGSLGVYMPDSLDSASNQTFSLQRYNRDPQRPYFGAIVSYSMNQNAEAGNQYPMVSFGACFNRYDDGLKYLSAPNYVMLSPVGKVDLMGGYALSNGGMIGIGTYFAFQKQETSGLVQYQSDFFRQNVGINWPLAKSVDLEASIGIMEITGIGDSIITPATSTVPALTKKDTIANGDVGVTGDLRMFTGMSSLNGDFVPHLGFDYISLVNNITNTDFNLGLGLNINIDKGFFWCGVEGLYQENDTTSTSESWSGVGVRVSGGLEMNLIWDWFVLRCGASKTIMYMSNGTQSGYFMQNPEADGSDNDLIGIGVGLNIENRLKIDGVIAEDIFYTGTNLLSGPMHHLQNRISITYSF